MVEGVAMVWVPSWHSESCSALCCRFSSAADDDEDGRSKVSMASTISFQELGKSLAAEPPRINRQCSGGICSMFA
jgi:hypothetical protein